MATQVATRPGGTIGFAFEWHRSWILFLEGNEATRVQLRLTEHGPCPPHMPYSEESRDRNRCEMACHQGRTLP